MLVLILGCGEMAHYLVPALRSQGHQITILEQASACDDHSVLKLDAESIQCTGILMDDLQRGKVNDAGMFLALSDDDNRNAMAAQIASQMFNVPNVLCHIGDYARYDAYKKLGLQVISSTVAVSETVLRSLEGQR